jgi:hypothetical protein
LLCRQSLAATCAALLILSGSGRAAALRLPGPELREAQFVIGPYLQDVRTDGVVVVWETDVPTSGMVRLDLPGRRTAFLSPPATHHEVRLSGLRPGTRYRYVVAIRPAADVERLARRPGLIRNAERRSEPAEFTTAPVQGPFTFLVYGDNRDRDGDHAQVIRAMLLELPDLLIQTGDMVGNAGQESQWRRYFAVATPLLRSTPMYPALGNHELRGDPDANHFYRYFVLPGGESPRRPAVYYAFRYSHALFIALDGNNPYDAGQAAWLERTLSQSSTDKGVRHVFAFVHQPPYAVGAYCGSEREQKRFVPLFSRYKVRAVFGGHEHAYQHLERGGVRYFVSGGGGAPLYFRTNPCSDADQRSLRMFKPEHHYLRVRVRGDEATLTAITKTGQVLEEVALHQPVPRVPGEEDEGPKVARTGPDSPLLSAALVLPLAAMMGAAVAASLFFIGQRLLRRRRRRDLLPGGEPAPRRRR